MQKYADLPQLPGVYRFYDFAGQLLYIGKAKNLKNRVANYFQNNKNPRTALMVSQISRVEYTIVTTENEALTLEADTIRTQQPKYNIKLKDDKSFVFVRISENKKITIVRQKYDKKSTYFGPYTKTSNIFETLSILRQIFPFCQEKFGFGKPCSYVQIKQCDGICGALETIENYNQKITQIEKVLTGKIDIVQEWLKTKMQVAIGLQNYELAGLWRDKSKLLSETICKNNIVLSQPLDLDIINLIVTRDISGLEIGSVFVQNIREGRVITVNNFLMSGSGSGETQEEIIQDFVVKFCQSYYTDNQIPIHLTTKWV
jgi:excinuclease ABC subunit C